MMHEEIRKSMTQNGANGTLMAIHRLYIDGQITEEFCKEAVEAVYARQELIDAAVELAASDMANMSVSKEELIAEAQKLTNEELLHFIEE